MGLVYEISPFNHAPFGERSTLKFFRVETWRIERLFRPWLSNIDKKIQDVSVSVKLRPYTTNAVRNTEDSDEKYRNKQGTACVQSCSDTECTRERLRRYLLLKNVNRYWRRKNEILKRYNVRETWLENTRANGSNRKTVPGETEFVPTQPSYWIFLWKPRFFGRDKRTYTVEHRVWYAFRYGRLHVL